MAILVAAIVILLANPVVAAGGRSDSNRPLAPDTESLSEHAGHAHVQKFLFDQPSTVNTLASVGSVALADLLLPDGSSELVLYDGHHNTTTVAQAVVPGGPFASEVTEVAAGGNFFLEFFNFNTGLIFYEEVSPLGVVSTPALPLSSLQLGLIGSRTTLFMTSLGVFLAVDPRTFAVQADYSSLIPTGVTVGYALSVGERLYIGGSQLVSGGGAVPFYGVIDRRAGTETTLSPSFLTPLDQSGTILWIGAADGKVYFGGMLTIVQFGPTFLYYLVAGYLFEFSPHSGKVSNLSSLDPLSRWGVQSIFTVEDAIVMNIASFSLTSTSLSQVSGTYVLGHHHKALVNETSLTGSDFVAVYLEASLSGGLYFVGGLNETTGTGEIVAIPVSLLEH
ncbi:MAG: hypothetical protein L3J97_03545 [Thermoplasmata archaeon]|nr:hypothetical protein [Thermoplasmata archaeon]